MEKGRTTNMKRIRRKGFILHAVLVLTLLAGMLPLQAGAAVVSPNLILTAGQSVETIKQDTQFILGLTYKNVTAGVITDLVIDFTAAENVALDNGGSIYIPDPEEKRALTIAGGGHDHDTVGIPMRFTGSGSDGRIPVRLIYKLDGTLSETSSSVTVKSVAASTSTSTPADTTKFKPALAVTVTGTNFTDGGQQNELRILVKNTDLAYAAKNVIIGLPDVNSSPFTAASFGNALPIAEILPNGSVELAVTVTTDAYATAGAYKLPLHMTYSNSWNDQFDADASVALTVRNAMTPGLLLVEAGTPVPPVAAGGDFTLPIAIRNQGSLPVSNVRISLTGLSSDAFMLSSGSSRLSWDRIDGSGAKALSLMLKAGAALKAGSAPLGFKLEYSDARGTKTEDTQEIWLSVAGTPESDSTIDILSVTPSRTNVNPGESVSVSVVVRNSGTSDAKQVKVSGEAAADVFFPISQNLYILKTMKPGETKKVTFSFQALEEAKRGSSPLSVKVETAVAGTETPVIITQAVSVFVAGPPTPADSSKNVPKIIVYSYSADPALVTAGSEFDLNLSFMNTHAGKSIRNIKANFTVNESSSETGSVFTPVGSSNTFYIDSIGPKGTVERIIRLYTIPDAKSKTYNVTISFDYEDTEGNPYKTDEIIGIPVYQPSRFEINEPSFQPDMMVGQPMSISFEMYNLGKTILYNVKMKVVCEPEGLIDVTPKSQYYGNYDPGKSEYAEVTLTPVMAGAANGKIMVTYESATGEVMEAGKEFSVNVAEMPPPPDVPGEVIGPDGKPVPLGPDGQPLPAEGEKGIVAKIIGSIWGKIGIGVIVLGIAVIIILRVRKKKQEKGLDF
jgi:hypothetical protein